MGQKVNPIGLRVGIIKGWRSRWFAEKNYGEFLKEDLKIRQYINGRLSRAGISKIEIERAGDRLKIDIFTARPGMVIGRRGAEVDTLRSHIEKTTDKQAQINIQEIDRPQLDAALVAQSIAEQLEARVSFRRAMKRAVGASMKSGALGIKIACAGRLGGSEMARSEWYREGRVPLHTLRADIDYGLAEALTTVGRIGVKVWIYRGDLWPGLGTATDEAADRKAETPRRERPRKEGSGVPQVEEKVVLPAVDKSAVEAPKEGTDAGAVAEAVKEPAKTEQAKVTKKTTKARAAAATTATATKAAKKPKKAATGKAAAAKKPAAKKGTTEKSSSSTKAKTTSGAKTKSKSTENKTETEKEKKE